MIYSGTVNTLKLNKNGKGKLIENNMLVCVSTQIETVRSALKTHTKECFNNGNISTGIIREWITYEEYTGCSSPIEFVENGECV